jgi:hypothetical protein
LLIFDNANNVDAVRPWVPSFPLPAGMSGHVVVTTRRAGFGVLGPVMELDVLARPASIELFRTRASGVDPDVAGEIADELGCLPLAVEQAATYLGRGGVPPESYLNLLRTRTAEMLGRGKVGTRDETVATIGRRYCLTCWRSLIGSTTGT